MHCDVIISFPILERVSWPNPLTQPKPLTKSGLVNKGRHLKTNTLLRTQPSLWRLKSHCYCKSSWSIRDSLKSDSGLNAIETIVFDKSTEATDGRLWRRLRNY